MKDINQRLSAELAESVVPFGEFDDVINQISENIKADHENPEATDDAEYAMWENAVPVDMPMDVEESEEAGDEGVTNVAKSMLRKRVMKAFLDARRITGR